MVSINTAYIFLYLEVEVPNLTIAVTCFAIKKGKLFSVSCLQGLDYLGMYYCSIPEIINQYAEGLNVNFS